MRKKTARKIHRQSMGQRIERALMLRGMGIKGLMMCALLFVVAFAGMAVFAPKALAAALILPIVFGTTLATDTPRDHEIGDRNNIPVIASDIIFEGAAVGVVDASGHARPLSAGDRFAGFCQQKADNSSGSAADIKVEVKKIGQAKLSVTGAVITDVGQPVYASDDNAFVFTPTSNSFIGFVKRFVSSGVVIVDYDVDNFVDPYDGWTVETVAANKTLDVEDTGKAFFVTDDAKTITLPATTTGLHCLIINGAAFGTVLVAVSPQAADKIMGPDLGGTNDKDHLNTKATARRGDLVELKDGHADGYTVVKQKGVWATEG